MQDSASLKILLIFQCYPPFNVIGSVRAAQLAAYLEGHGHELRIVAGDGLPFPPTLDVPPLKAKIFRAIFRSIERPIDFGRKLLGTVETSGGSATVSRDGMMIRAVRAYRALFAIPDNQVGWYPAAAGAASRATKDWTPEVIISSALPFTSHLVAAGIVRDTGAPWIAEYRDLFSGNPYADIPEWRQWLDRQIERRIMTRATAIVGLTPQMSEELAAMHGKPTLTVMNGFDVRNSSSGPPVETGRHLRILYTGIVYPGRRDPRPLFEAIRSMGERGRRVIVDFYGQDLRGVQATASAIGIESQVRVHPTVSYSESLRLQAEADILLLLLWDDPRERGTLTGKVFEYIGAARPILSIGSLDGVASNLIRERGLGVTASHPQIIAQALDRWFDQIDSLGTVPSVSPTARQGLSRAEQFADYDKLIAEVTSQRGSGMVHHLPAGVSS